MEIQIKQAELVEGVKHYISNQGINLVDKDVTIVFTARRKGGGISATMTIKDIDIPGFSEPEEEAAVVEPSKETGLFGVATTPVVVETAAIPQEEIVVPEEPIVATPVAPKTTNSLFA